MPEIINKMETMNCGVAKEPLDVLKENGWEYELSFNSRFTDQWNYACGRVKTLQLFYFAFAIAQPFHSAILLSCQD